MAAGNLDIMLEHGGTFELILDVYDDEGLPFVMSGWIPSMRLVHRASGTVTNVSGISAGVNSVNIFMSVAAVNALEAENTDYTPRQIKNRDTKYAYDVTASNGSVVKKIVRGNAFVVRDIG